MPRRLLVLLSQNPLDPSNGATRSLDSIARLLSRDGDYEVEVLGTTSTECADPQATGVKLGFLSNLGIVATTRYDQGGCLIKFTRDKVRYTLVDTGTIRLHQPHSIHGPRFERIYGQILKCFRPQILLTFGAFPIERQRHREAQLNGAAVVLSLHNHNYLDRSAFEYVDAVHTCSQYLREYYRKTMGIESVALNGPLIPEDVVAPKREPLFVTFVNPSYEKGLVFVARLAEELAKRRPDIPLLVIESRGTSGTLVTAGDAGGFDLRRHPSLMTTPPVASPRDFFSTARILLAPSLCNEAWPRVAAEGLLNGVPPLASDRGGLPEACNGGGYVFTLPKELTPQTLVPPPAETVMPWIDLIERLCDDESAYAAAMQRALDAAKVLMPSDCLPRFLEFFDSIRPHVRRTI
ncbi:MAG TPA: hypothetical protein VMD30_13365 [Tepidisphaeraceae bacterium]|nr:hypothetical protein [Tepidisphaeraceae bacterium]